MSRATASTQTSPALVTLTTPEPEDRSLAFALPILSALDLRPVFFYAAPVEDKKGVARLQARLRERLARETVEVRHATGDPEEVTLEELARTEYSLVVLGLSPRLEGQPAMGLSLQHIARRSPTNVLAVQNPPEALEEILICTGGSQASTTAARWGIRLAGATGARATVLHVASKAPSMYSGLSMAEENLERVLARETPLADHLKGVATMASQAGVQAGLELRHGVVAEEILRACDLHAYGLIVLGAAQPSSLIDRLLLEEVGPQVLASTDRSILIVRGEPSP